MGGHDKTAQKQYQTVILPKATTSLGDGASNGPDRSNSRNEASKARFEWVAVEHRDADGNRMFPRQVIESTYLRRYTEVPDGAEIKILMLVGYKPKDLMLVERKIYEVHRLSVCGWRRSGQIAVEMEGWRQHEADWFNAMHGVGLEISHPDFPGSQSQKSDYIVSGTAFHRKTVTLVGDDGNTEHPMFEGTLDITETWRSAWRRQAAEVMNMGFKNFLLPLFSALVSGLVVWWIVSPPNSDGVSPVTPESSTEQQAQPSVQYSPAESSERSGNFDAPRPSSPETGFKRHESADTPSISEPSTEGSGTEEHKGKPEPHTNTDLPEQRKHVPEQPG